MPIDPTLAYDDDNIFAKILRGEIPSTRVYEDEDAIDTADIAAAANANPVALKMLKLEDAYLGFNLATGLVGQKSEK